MGIFFSVVFLIAGVVLATMAWFMPLPNNISKKWNKIASVAVLSFALIFVYVGNSFVNVSKDTLAVFTKTMWGEPLANGKIIAVDGENGPQADFMRQGYFQHVPLVYLNHDSNEVELTVVPEGKVGVLSAKDGAPMKKDQFFAEDWYTQYLSTLKEGQKPQFTREEYETKMLEPRFFLTHGGIKGPQYTVLKPGKYAISPVLWNFDLKNATIVPTGHVGVVTSRVGKIYANIERSAEGSKLATPLVPEGYIGVRKEVLTTGNYYFNPNAISVQIEDMRAQVWTYKGGYTPREIEVSVGVDGKIVQNNITHAAKPRPENAADEAVAVKTKDKYTIYVELRMQVQPDPDSIAGIVAGIGSIDEVENKVVTPAVRSVLRNIGENYDAIDFITKRSEIEAKFRDSMVERTKIAGVPAKEVYLANVDVPPAVVVPGKIKELSAKMLAAYKEQDTTYKQLIKTNETKATADQQGELVTGKIADQKAQYMASAREKQGIGEQKYLEALAKGNKAVKDVFGSEQALQLQITREMISLCKEKPEVCSNVPVIYSTSAGASNDSEMLEAFGALGLQNIIKTGKVLSQTK